MMKFAALAISLFLVSNPSLAKRTPVQLALDGQRLTTQKTQIATKSVLAHVASRTQRRLLVINEIIDDNDDEPGGPDDLDLQAAYARPRLVNREKIPEPEEELSDYVLVRLAVARARAMEAYRKKYAINTG